MDNFQKYILKLTICLSIILIVIGFIEIFKGMNELKEQIKTNEMIFEQEYINFCLEDSIRQSDIYE